MATRARLGSLCGSILLVAAACYLLVGFSQGFILAAWSWKTWLVYLAIVLVYPVGLWAGWWQRRDPP